MEELAQQAFDTIAWAYYGYMAVGGGGAVLNYAKARMDDEGDMGYLATLMDDAEEWGEKSAEMGEWIDKQLEGEGRETNFEERMEGWGTSAYLLRHPWRAGKAHGYYHSRD